ncbi:hypothetical protein TSOC_011602 [Tetrabaena socialis]|uniref:RAP domain-containing protein n=1 Tax=Tetrabaena socialis TaxID=47790 RepID=A0A2J7ZQ93_9CHLO|nr:hypothetical protein TSOC_011602 [Tetrabaena socialis]|eukprot:PNH02426.1 hypothetical protein TSOC_011602 [Tetrabaena socialis]
MLGMAPGQQPRDGDPSRAGLLHHTLATLAAAYLPLVPRLKDAKHCVVPLWACAKAGYWGGGLAAALLQRLWRDGGELMLQANSQGHANMWWSLSTAPLGEVLQAADTEALMNVSADSLLRMGAADIEPQHCSNVLLACARLRRCPGPLLHHLTACLAAQPEANQQDLTNGLYTLGELCEDCGHSPRPQDLQRLAAQVVGWLTGEPRATGSWRQQEGSGGGFIPQGLSNMLLGCSKLGYADLALLRPLADAAGQAAGRHAPAVECLAAEVQQRLQRQPNAFAPQNLSNILYALALLQPERGPQWSAVVELLAAECRRREFAGFSAQDISMSAWALEKLGYRNDQGWFAAAVAGAVQPGVMSAFNQQDFTNLWCTLALVRHRPATALLEGTIAASEALRTQGQGQTCAGLLWALATLGGPHDKRLVDVLVKRLWELLPREVDEQEMSNSMWALAVIGPRALFRYRRFVKRLLRKLARRWNETEAAAVGHGSCARPINTLGLIQLQQVQVELAHADGCSELAGILAAAGGGDSQQPGSLLSAMRYAAEGQEQADSTTSVLQRQVVSALGRLQRQQQAEGVPLVASVAEEQLVEGLVGRVDVVVELAGGRRVAVEVDGPTHFLANDPHTKSCNGPTKLRDRCLGRLFGAGNVASVPYWQWDELRRDKVLQEEYLLGLLSLAPCGP